MTVPRASVLLPVRDAAATLGECCASLQAQTLGDHEVIAVDDGSVDGSAEILAALAAADRRWIVVRPQTGGLVAALNLAAATARSPLLVRMDADDVCHPDRLARQCERLERDGTVDVLGSAVELFGGTDNRGMRTYVSWLNGLSSHAQIGRERFVESPLVHPSVAMRAAWLRRLGGYRDTSGPEDYDLWLRAWDAGARFAVEPEVLLRWRDGPGRLTRRDPRYGAGRFQDLKLLALERGPLQARPPVVVWGAGPVGKGWSRALTTRGHRVVAFADVHPRRLGQHIHGVPVVTSAEAAGVPGAVHLAAVGQPGGRERVRAEAARHGIVDGEGLWAVA